METKEILINLWNLFLSSILVFFILSIADLIIETIRKSILKNKINRNIKEKVLELEKSIKK